MDEEQRRMAEEILFSENRKPSFAKLLYGGVFDSRHVFPYPEVSAAERQHTEELLDRLKFFCEREIDAAAIDRDAQIPQSVIRGLGRIGILGLSVPTKFGGLGMTQYAYCRALEQLASHCGSTALMVNAHQSVGLKAIQLFGTESQQNRWLKPLATGEALAAFSLTEPNAGSDAAGIETTAEYDPQKKVYRINGNKQWTTNGSIARVLTLMARTEDGKVTAFIVTPEMPGFKVTAKALEKVGYRGTWTANLDFQNMEVPEENILGEKGKGLKICLTVLDYGRTTFGATCTGVAKYLVSRAVDHAIKRRQFKQPLARFQLVKQKLAEMSALAYAMDASTYLTAGLIDAGVADIMLETAILKVFASESLWKILYDTMQIFGGRSFFTTEPFERMMRDARINMIGEGSNEVLRVFIGAVGLRDLGLQLQASLNAARNPARSFKGLYGLADIVLRKISRPAVPVLSPLFHDEARRMSLSIRRFAFSALRLLAKYRESVVEEQLKLNRIAECAISLYTVTAVLSRIDLELKQMPGGGASADPSVALARFYCNLALDRFDRSLDCLFADNRDREIASLSDFLTGDPAQWRI
jgi:alkylation response protein AidB-like acyl-CoA dehydrogenase